MSEGLRWSKLNRLAAAFATVVTASLVGFPATPVRAGEQAAKEGKKIDVFQVLVVNEDGSNKGKEKGYVFAGVVVDRARTVKRDQTDAEVKVADRFPTGSNSGKPFDVVLLVRPDAISKGKILVLTAGPVANCRAYLKTFLTKTLSSKRISKAYKDAKLALVDDDATAKSLAGGLVKNGWLRGC